LIVFMTVFTPWAFGTTQSWSIWTMNVTAYLLGALLLAKWTICRISGYRPFLWGQKSAPGEESLFGPKGQDRDALTLTLAALTVLLLAYILLGALNSRATFIESERHFDYRRCIEWLPHSYDSTSTWNAFWIDLGLACFFWAARDWLLGKSPPLRLRLRVGNQASLGHRPIASALALSQGWLASTAQPGISLVSAPSARQSRFELPARLQFILWVLSINGALLALEAILQRLSGTNQLLWLVQPRFNTAGIYHFGPYAYRANAASYFNLVWPVCLGFWLVLRQAARGTVRTARRVGQSSYLVLLPGAVLMAACPIIATTRGGSLISIGSIFILLFLLLRSTRNESPWFRMGACSLFLAIFALAGILGLDQLMPRFKTLLADQISNRTEILHNAVPIAHDFPVFGTGAGTFGSLYPLYRTRPDQEWAAYVHDDWLETRITLGWAGLSLILLMLGTVLARWFVRGGLPVAWEFAGTIWVAMTGCLLHAKFDFPFQIYSVLFVFLLLAAILFCLSRPLHKW
jgi:hypothetical protein